MLSSAGRKLNPIEKEAEKRAYADLHREINTKKGTIIGLMLLGTMVLACFLIQKYTNLRADSLIVLISAGLVFSTIIILYSRYKFKKRKRHHYLKILKTGSYTDQESTSPGLLDKKKSLEEAYESILKKLDPGETKWDWVIYAPIILLLIIGGLSTKYPAIDPYMKQITLLLLSVTCFGWLISMWPKAEPRACQKVNSPDG